MGGKLQNRNFIILFLLCLTLAAVLRFNPPDKQQVLVGLHFYDHNKEEIEYARSASSVTVLACDKPDSGTKLYFEMYKQSSSGSGLSVCLGSTCITDSAGYAKSPNFPISGYSSVQNIPATCTGGTLTTNNYDGCRHLVCESGSVTPPPSQAVFMSVDTTIKNSGAIPMLNLRITDAKPDMLHIAYATAKPLSTLSLNQEYTWKSELMDISPYKDQTLDLSVTIGTDYKTGTGDSASAYKTGLNSIYIGNDYKISQPPIPGQNQTPPSTTLTAFEQEVLTKMRERHYVGYPNSFTGFAKRDSGDTTSETMGMVGVVECSYGSLDYCKKILKWMDTNIWSKGNGDDTFAWHFNEQATLIGGPDSAADGDLMLIWSAMRGCKRGDSEICALYTKWKPNIQAYDTCRIGSNVFMASGSGIGRWNGCNSYNGVYAAYLMPALLYDLKNYDSSWTAIYTGSMEQTYDMFNQATFPGRCAAYDGTNYNWAQCELNPNYFDVWDAQRIVFWTGSVCRKVSHPACDKLKNLVNNYVASDGGVSNGGYELNGISKGTIQFNDFNTALWCPAIDVANGKCAQIMTTIEGHWSGSDFSGTSGDGVDLFKDLHILISSIEERHGLSP